jgi:hypothetical protein
MAAAPPDFIDNAVRRAAGHGGTGAAAEARCQPPQMRRLEVLTKLQYN